ncbi:MAG TPA: glycosyltransferase family 87 protein [Thermoanaerobaculia bacterium]
MTRTQKQIVVALTILIAITRVLAFAHGLFDWDEAQFANGVRSYDVTQHHPHPPGYPLFIGAAKIVHAIGVANEFRAVQVIVLLGSMLLFPALFFLARELDFDFATACCAATIFAFLPNVWIYGGTGFTDVPATAMGLIACVFLLRGRTDSRAYVIGAILLGIAAGIRPLNLMMGAAPALVATYTRIRARAFGAVAIAMLSGAVIVAASYIGAGLASESWPAFVTSVREQSQYVRNVDSWHNPHRPPLRHAAKTFFLWPFAMRRHMLWIAALGCIGLLGAMFRRRGGPFFVLAIFTPVAILSWLNLDIEAVARYSIAYFGAHALLAAEGIATVMLIFGRKRAWAQALFTIAGVITMVRWVWPAIEMQRTSDPPPTQIMQWVRTNIDPLRPVYVHGGIGPHAEYFLPDYQTKFFESPEEISMLFGDSYIVDLVPDAKGVNFTWPRRRLSDVLRRRNFEMSVRRVSTMLKYGAGWHDPEDGFRWMGAESKTTLPAFGGQGTLKINMNVPLDLVASPTIEIVFNGATLDRFVATDADIERTWTVASRSDAPNELILRTSAVANLAKQKHGQDARDLGLRINELTWTPLD